MEAAKLKVLVLQNGLISSDGPIPTLALPFLYYLFRGINNTPHSPVSSSISILGKNL